MYDQGAQMQPKAEEVKTEVPETSAPPPPPLTATQLRVEEEKERLRQQQDLIAALQQQEAAEMEAATDAPRRMYQLEQLARIEKDGRTSEVNQYVAEWFRLDHKANTTYFTNRDDRMGRVERRLASRSSWDEQCGPGLASTSSLGEQYEPGLASGPEAREQHGPGLASGTCWGEKCRPGLASSSSFGEECRTGLASGKGPGELCGPGLASRLSLGEPQCGPGLLSSRSRSGEHCGQSSIPTTLSRECCRTGSGAGCCGNLAVAPWALKRWHTATRCRGHQRAFIAHLLRLCLTEYVTTADRSVAAPSSSSWNDINNLDDDDGNHLCFLIHHHHHPHHHHHQQQQQEQQQEQQGKQQAAVSVSIEFANALLVAQDDCHNAQRSPDDLQPKKEEEDERRSENSWGDRSRYMEWHVDPPRAWICGHASPCPWVCGRHVKPPRTCGLPDYPLYDHVAGVLHRWISEHRFPMIMDQIDGLSETIDRDHLIAQWTPVICERGSTLLLMYESWKKAEEKGDHREEEMERFQLEKRTKEKGAYGEEEERITFEKRMKENEASKEEEEEAEVRGFEKRTKEKGRPGEEMEDKDGCKRVMQEEENKDCERGVAKEVADVRRDGSDDSVTMASSRMMTVAMMMTQTGMGCMHDLLQTLGDEGLRCCLGLRTSEGSLRHPVNGVLIPSRWVLLQSFQKLHGDGKATLTKGARALSKHAHRSTDKWWGVFTGTIAEKNRLAVSVILDILDNAMWHNVHWLPHDLAAYEVLLTASEAERLVEGLCTYGIDEVGSVWWLQQREWIDKLNIQAHYNTMAHKDEFVMATIN
ncbi:hypothetical protein CBR_g21778 [Chara braunii]|uniref:Uncharacterized protein n=1 Tax=Chara braunii TaxID=69332 RepID=A0A388JUJ7_CHABU|nr:hypothetical protein CBR_g21778 [Chara braunii]|eukprot:GBG61433.1 hypothetical protein CBR_g21778 [Chara braunii]